jgi:WD40 repeat protein
VATTTLDGGPVAVTASRDATVRVWDLSTGTSIGDPLIGRTSAVYAVASMTLDGRPVAVTGNGDATVRVWDLSTGTPITDPLIGHTSSVYAVRSNLLVVARVTSSHRGRALPRGNNDSKEDLPARRRTAPVTS